MKPPPTPPPPYIAQNASTLGHTGHSSAGSALDGETEAGARRRRYSEDYPHVRNQAGQSDIGLGGFAIYYGIQQTGRRKPERSVSFVESFEEPWPTPVAPTPIRRYAVPPEWEREQRRSSKEHKDGSHRRRRG